MVGGLPNRQRRLRGRRVLRPRRRRGKTKTGTARGGAQTRTGRPEPGVYAVANPSKINGSIFIILGSARRADPPGQGGKVENSPADGEHPEKTPRKGRKPTLPPCPGGLFCVLPRPSIINMYLFFHFNLDCATEQTPVCPGREGRGRIIRPRRVGGVRVYVRSICPHCA